MFETAGRLNQSVDSGGLEEERSEVHYRKLKSEW